MTVARLSEKLKPAARRNLDRRRITLLGGGAVDTGENQAAVQGSAREQSRSWEPARSAG